MLTLRVVSPDVEIVVSGSPPPLDTATENAVQSLWDCEAADKGGRLFNGQTFTATGISTERIDGHFVEYRRLVAQLRDKALYDSLELHPVAVSGVLECRDGIVFGHRNAGTTHDAGMWELAPSGGVDQSCVGKNGSVDIRRQILAELTEELGFDGSGIDEIKTLCLIEDSETHLVDIALSLKTGLSGADIVATHAARASDEYEAIEIVASVDIGKFVERLDDQIIGASRLLLDHLGYLA